MSDYDMLVYSMVHKLTINEIVAREEGLTYDKVRNRVERAQRQFLAKHGRKVARLIRKMEKEDGADSRKLMKGVTQ